MKLKFEKKYIMLPYEIPVYWLQKQLHHSISTSPILFIILILNILMTLGVMLIPSILVGSSQLVFPISYGLYFILAGLFGFATNPLLSNIGLVLGLLLNIPSMLISIIVFAPLNTYKYIMDRKNPRNPFTPFQLIMKNYLMDIDVIINLISPKENPLKDLNAMYY